MDLRKIKGRAVVAIASGEKVGEVDDVVIDGQERRVAAFNISEGGFLRKHHVYLAYDGVSSIGEDAVMVQADDVFRQSYGDRADGYFTLESLTKVRVVTESGTYLGDVASAYFEPTDGRLTEIEVGTGGFFRSNTLIDAGSLTSVGSDIFIVPDNVGQAS